MRKSIVVAMLALPITAWTANLGQLPSSSASLGAEKHAGWRSIGPTPPSIDANIAVDARSHTIYIGTVGAGVIKSSDGGATFHAVNNGLPNGTISGLAMSPDDSNVVYVNTQFEGFYKTLDGGAHWTGGNWGGLTLVMDPNNPKVMYGASGPLDYLLKTTDGGENWTYVANGLGEALVFAIAIDPHDSNVLYAGSAGGGAFKSIDAGGTWKPIKIDSNVSVILVDPDHSNIVYAGTDGHGIFKSTDGGRSFVRVGSPRVASILSLAKSGQTLYAGTATEGVSESIDGGKTWTNSRVSSGLGNVLSVDSQGSVYVGTNFDGAFVRSVSDSVWRPIGAHALKRCACQEGDAIAIDPSDHDHVLLTTNTGGLLASDDGGRSWYDSGEGLTSSGPRTVAFDPQNPRRVYAGSIWGGGLFRSEDGGRHWQRRKFGPADITVYGIAVDPLDHSVYATAQGGEGLWKSTDFGNHFTRIDRAPGAPAGVYLGLSGTTVTVDPQHPATVYLPDSGMGGLWRSQDAGRTWVEVDASDSFISVTVDPTNSSIVYAGGFGLGGYSLLKSIDGGATFIPKSVGLPLAQVAETGSLQVDPRHPHTLYVGMEDGGVFKSTDGAETWFPINVGFGGTSHYDLSITGLAMDPDAPDTLYAATFYHSVFKTVTGGR